jgi:hypothetical protein
MLHRAFYNLGQSHRLIMHLSKKKKKTPFCLLFSYSLLSLKEAKWQIKNEQDLLGLPREREGKHGSSFKL